MLQNGQALYQPGFDLQDQQRVAAAETAVLSHVALVVTVERLQQPGTELQHKRRINAVDSAAAVDVTKLTALGAACHRCVPSLRYGLVNRINAP